MERQLQLATTIAFLVLCLVGIALGVKHLVAPEAPQAVVASARGRPAAPPIYQAGEQIQVRGVDFATTDRTLLLVVRQGCRFCDESMPFYRKLGTDSAVTARTRIVLVAPDDESVSREELARHGVQVAQVVTVPLGDLKVRGTPTAIIVNRTGTVQRVLTGRLDDAGQEALVEALKNAP
jgi:hypothetical protein